MKKSIGSIFLLLACFISLNVKAQNNLWGMTAIGGKYGVGTIFKLDSNGTNQEVIHSFYRFEGSTPGYSKVCVGPDNKLYGTTLEGGKDDWGVFYEYDIKNNSYNKLIEFSASDLGSKPFGMLTLASNGNIYGVTTWGGEKGVGGIFEFNPQTKVFVKKAAFSPTEFSDCKGGIIETEPGIFYGLCSRGGSSDKGVIFEYNLATNSLSKQQDLATTVTGTGAHGSFLKASNGKLYALNTYGGRSGMGTLLEYDHVNKLFKTKIHFDGRITGEAPFGEVIETAPGILMGTTFNGGSENRGKIFEYNLNTNTYKGKIDFDWEITGAHPNATLVIGDNGKIYGTTSQGGSTGTGVIFEYDTATNVLTKKFDIGYHPDQARWGYNGNYCASGMVKTSDGLLYSVTTSGGAGGKGVLFEYNTVTQQYNTKVNFDSAPDGKNPYGNLLLASDGKLYGATSGGGLYNGGTIFSISPVTLQFEVEFNFEYYSNGSSPLSLLTEREPGKITGQTSGGSSSMYGNIFEFDFNTKSFTILKEFTPETGIFGGGGLLKASNGKLYGTLQSDNNASYSNIFSYDITDGFVKLVSYDSSKGLYPTGMLVELNKKLYGICSLGGLYNEGTLIEFDLTTTSFRKLVDLENAVHGRGVQGGLTVTEDNTLLGIAQLGGKDDMGLIFEYDPTSGIWETLLNFSDYGITGYSSSTPARADNGKYYGMTNSYGENGLGIIYELDRTQKTLQKKFDFDKMNGGAYNNTFILVPAKSNITSVNSFTKTNQIKIYPNPVKDLLKIENVSGVEIVNIEVTDLLGKVIVLKKNFYTTNSLDVSMLNPGIYFMKIFTDLGAFQVEFVKTNN